MTIKSICGWELLDVSEGGGSAGTVSIATDVKRSGQASVLVNPTTTGTGYAAHWDNAATGAPAQFSLTDIYARAYVRIDTLPAANSEELIFLQGSRGAKFTVRINSDGTLTAYGSAGTSLLATGSKVLTTGVFYRINIKCGTGSSAAWEVLVDGVSDISGTSNLGADTTREVRYGKVVNRNSQTVKYYFDDSVVSDSSHPGPGAIEILQPDANGNYQNWNIGAGGGSNYQQVDEVPNDGDTTYLVSTSSTNAETEALESATNAAIVGTINSVQSFAVVKRDSATNGSVNLRLRSGSTDNDTSSAYASTSSYVILRKVYETDPATSAAWLRDALDSLETGLLNNSAANMSRMTTTGVMVYYTPITYAAAYVGECAWPVFVNSGTKTLAIIG